MEEERVCAAGGWNAEVDTTAVATRATAKVFMLSVGNGADVNRQLGHVLFCDEYDTSEFGRANLLSLSGSRVGRKTWLLRRCSGCVIFCVRQKEHVTFFFCLLFSDQIYLPKYYVCTVLNRQIST